MNFENLKGLTLTKIDVSDDKDEIVFTDSEGRQFRLYHEQDCCESVTIEDICGDLDDLIGEPLLVAEEVVHEQNVMPGGVGTGGYVDESFLWTFYKLDTTKGGITIRWLGSSNGYYSESVNFCVVNNLGKRSYNVYR